jgi:hypothetical protein
MSDKPAFRDFIAREELANALAVAAFFASLGHSRHTPRTGLAELFLT